MNQYIENHQKSTGEDVIVEESVAMQERPQKPQKTQKAHKAKRPLSNITYLMKNKIVLMNQHPEQRSNSQLIATLLRKVTNYRKSGDYKAAAEEPRQKILAACNKTT